VRESSRSRKEARTMARKIKAILVDVMKETSKVVEIETELEAYYKALDCDCIDIVTRQIGRKTFSIVCDDEGIYRQPKISAIDNLGNVMLMGNLLICNRKGPELDSLTADDIKYIKERIVDQGTRMYPKGYPMVMQCTYA